MLKTFSSIFNHRRCHFKNHPPHSPNTNEIFFKCKVLLILSYFYQGLYSIMDSQEFRKRGTEMVEYICQYLETLEDRKVTPSVEPGYLRSLIPDEAPNMPEAWEKIMEDVESKIMPGVTHWQHPRFHAYFPAGNSFPSILGDMLGDAIGCIGFSWVFLKISE